MTLKGTKISIKEYDNNKKVLVKRNWNKIYLFCETLVVLFLMISLYNVDLSNDIIVQYFAQVLSILSIIYVFNFITFFVAPRISNMKFISKFIMHKCDRIESIKITIAVIIAIISLSITFSIDNWDLGSIIYYKHVVIMCLLTRVIFFHYILEFVICLYNLVVDTIKENKNCKILSCIILKKFVYITVIFAAILVISNIWRFILYIKKDAWWGDEVFFIKTSNLNFYDLINASIRDVNPPLHYILTRFLLLLFGSSPLVYRFFSFAPYIICSIYGFYFFCKNFNVESAALWVTLISTAYYSVYHMMDARMYYLNFLFVFLMYIAVYNIITKDRIRDWVILLLASTLSLYTHTYSTLFVFFMYLALLSIILIKKRITLKIILLYIISILFYLPWIGILFSQFNKVSGMNDLWIPKVTTQSILVSFFIYKNGGKTSLFLFCFFVALILLWSLYSIGAFYRNSKKQFDFIKENVYLFIGLASIILTIFISQLFSNIYRPMLVFRYVFPLQSVVFIVTIIICNRYRFKTMILLFACVLAFIIGMRNLVFDINERKYINESFQQTKDLVDEQLSSGDKRGIILTDHNHIAWNVADYQFPGCEVYLIQNYVSSENDLGKPVILLLNFSSAPEVANEFANEHNVSTSLLREYGMIGSAYHVNVYKVDN